MKVTVLGHASVLLEMGDARVLVDPLFAERFAGDTLRFAPARALDADALVDAASVLVITHDHLDHFHPPTLERFPRDRPVIAPRHPPLLDALRALGFTRVEALDPWSRRAVGNGALVATPSDFEDGEFGVLAVDDDGAYWHMSDSIVTEPVGRRVKSVAGRVSLVATRFQPLRTLAGYQRGLESVSLDRAELAGCLEAACAAAPAALFPYFAGFAFDGEHAWANRHLAPYRPAEIARLFRRRLGDGAAVHTVAPGDVFELHDAGAELARAASPVARTLPSPEPEGWEPVDTATLWGLPSPRQQAWLRDELRDLMQRGVLPWIWLHLERASGLFDGYRELQAVWQGVVHAGEGVRLHHAVDFRGARPVVYLDRLHPDANVFSHVGGRSLWRVLRGDAGAELFWMAGGYRLCEKLLLIEDGRFRAPPCEGWDLYQRLPEPITHYLRKVGVQRLVAGD